MDGGLLTKAQAEFRVQRMAFFMDGKEDAFLQTPKFTFLIQKSVTLELECITC
jgi:hypothetical protein